MLGLFVSLGVFLLVLFIITQLLIPALFQEQPEYFWLFRSLKEKEPRIEKRYNTEKNYYKEAEGHLDKARNSFNKTVEEGEKTVEEAKEKIEQTEVEVHKSEKILDKIK